MDLVNIEKRKKIFTQSFLLKTKVFNYFVCNEKKVSSI